MSPKKPAEPRAKATVTSPLILVVDDFEDNRAMYVEYLQFQGFRVAEAVNGEEAVLRTRDLLPSVIIMDLSLPIMDGWEATRRVKADPRTSHIRVIALTGHAEPAHAKKALEAGCDDFVAKPCLPEHLLTKIREHLATLERVTASPGETPRSARPRSSIETPRSAPPRSSIETPRSAPPRSSIETRRSSPPPRSSIKSQKGKK